MTISKRSSGLLKLAPDDADAYHLALQNYGFETSAQFLRACALALIRQDKANQRLLSPLAFQTTEYISKHII